VHQIENIQGEIEGDSGQRGHPSGIGINNDHHYAPLSNCKAECPRPRRCIRRGYVTQVGHYHVDPRHREHCEQISH
jgi:hypothetical protein